MSWLHWILFLPPQASSIAPEVDRLHYFVILTTMIASLFVGASAIYFFVRYRRRSDAQRTPRVVAPWWVEGLIWGVPLTFFLVWFAMGFRLFVRIETPPADALTVYVTGKQWMWQYAYPDGPSSIDVLRVPAGRNVRLLLTSRDVIHSFYVPDFRVKQDAIPGRYTQIWFAAKAPGHYQVLCAEYCGAQHSTMWGEVEAMAPEAFEEWVASRRRGISDAQDTPATPGSGAPEEAVLATEGRRVAERAGCLKCHTLDGTPHIGPTWLDLYGRRQTMSAPDGLSVVADEAYLTESMMDPLAKIVAGYAPVMPTYRGQLGSGETAAILELIRSLQSGNSNQARGGGPDHERIPGK